MNFKRPFHEVIQKEKIRSQPIRGHYYFSKQKDRKMCDEDTTPLTPTTFYEHDGK
jgi:hypothetical protein